MGVVGAAGWQWYRALCLAETTERLVGLGDLARGVLDSVGHLGARLMDPVRNPALLMAQVAEKSDYQALAIPDFREQYILQARQPLWHFGYKTPEEDQFSRLYAWLKEARRTAGSC